MHRSPHPLAWWAWAVILAAATTRLTDARLLGLLLGVVVTVVLLRRGDSPWGRSFDAYLVLGVCIVAVRVVFHVVVGIKTPGTVVLDLPRVALPQWAVGVQLLGPVTAEGLADAATQGLRLAVLVVCVGAANALANPRRALRALPASLHHMGTAVVIAVSVTPQLVHAAGTVRRAQRLRGAAPRGLRAVRATLVPVLTDALDRSLALAASMDSRGYARTLPGRSDRRVSGLLLTALVAAALGVYGLLTGAPTARSLVAGGAAVLATVGASVLAGRQVCRTQYRPDRWQAVDSVLVATGAGAAFAFAAAAQSGGGPGWTGLGVLLALVALIGSSPVTVAPRPVIVAARPAAS